MKRTLSKYLNKGLSWKLKIFIRHSISRCCHLVGRCCNCRLTRRLFSLCQIWSLEDICEHLWDDLSYIGLFWTSVHSPPPNTDTEKVKGELLNISKSFFCISMPALASEQTGVLMQGWFSVLIERTHFPWVSPYLVSRQAEWRDCHATPECERLKVGRRGRSGGRSSTRAGAASCSDAQTPPTCGRRHSSQWCGRQTLTHWK